MDPNTPAPTPPVLPPNYEFIMAQNQKPGRGVNLGSGGKKQRIMVVAFGGLLLLIVSIIFIGIIGASGKKGDAELIDLLAYQTELQRVITLGTQDATSSAVKGVAQTASLTLATDIGETTSLLKRKGVKIDPKQLVKYKSSESDSKLAEAKTANVYDTTYKELLEEKLANYQKKLSAVYQTQQSSIIQTSLKDYSVHAKLLSANYTPDTTTTD